MLTKPDTPCREWPGRRTPGGYGVYNRGTVWTGGPRSQVLIHRWIVAQIDGWEAIEGRDVMHRCDNPPCFLYEHLVIGTRGENIKDAHDKGRMKLPHRMGEQINTAKLVEADVLRIRELHATGRYRHKELARMFDILPGTVWQIVNYKTWKHLP